MASRLDQALDEVIKDRRSNNNNNNNNNNNGSGRRRNNNNNNNNNRDRNDIPRRRQMDNDGYIRKRLGPSDTIKSFVRTVNVQKNDTRGSRNVNSAWAHDMFDDESSAGSSILSRLGGRGTNEPARNKGSYISVENLHYDVTEKDLSELFSTVADVLQAKLVFDISGRSTGVATIKYASLEDAEKAIKKYNNVELDGQSMRIELKEYTPRAPRSTGGGRFNNNRLDSRRNDNRGGDRRGDRRGGDRRGGRDRGNRDDNRNGGGNSRDNKKNDRSKQNMTAEDLDKEMDNYMNSTNNEDTDMMLD